MDRATKDVKVEETQMQEEGGGFDVYLNKTFNIQKARENMKNALQLEKQRELEVQSKRNLELTSSTNDRRRKENIPVREIDTVNLIQIEREEGDEEEVEEGEEEGEEEHVDETNSEEERMEDVLLLDSQNSNHLQDNIVDQRFDTEENNNTSMNSLDSFVFPDGDGAEFPDNDVLDSLGILEAESNASPPVRQKISRKQPIIKKRKDPDTEEKHLAAETDPLNRLCS